jgi:hypothetical protein
MGFETISSFPNEILTFLYVKWFGPLSIGRLDSACCNKIVRSQYLSLLPNFVSIRHNRFRVNVPKATFEGFMTWVLTRNIRLKQLWLMPNNYDQNGKLIYSVVTVGIHFDYIRIYKQKPQS